MTVFFAVPLLHAYFNATKPLRKRLIARWASQGQAPITMVYFHRIADDRATPWTSSHVMFQRQVEFLREHYEMVSYDECVRCLREKRCDRPIAHVTFDDGYSDNCNQALPWLVEQRIPCTYFVTTSNILAQQPFSHDVKRRRPLAVNTPDEIKWMADSGIEIGAHTRTHVNLGKITDAEQLRDEIGGSKDDLESIIGGPVRYFAFPFGWYSNVSPLAFQVAKEVGFESVCTAYGGYNFPGGDPFHLQRFDATPSLIQYKNWLLFDPLKHLRVRRYEYGALNTGSATLPAGSTTGTDPKEMP